MQDLDIASQVELPLEGNESDTRTPLPPISSRSECSTTQKVEHVLMIRKREITARILETELRLYGQRTLAGEDGRLRYNLISTVTISESRLPYAPDTVSCPRHPSQSGLLAFFCCSCKGRMSAR